MIGQGDMWARWFYAMAILLSGIVVTALTPPFQTADEPTHLIRAIQLSRGEIRGRIQNAQMGCDIPQAIITDMRGYRGLNFAEGAGVTPDAWQARYDAAAAWTDDLWRDVSFAPCQFQHYPPLAHLMPTFVAAAGSLLHLNTIEVVYAARLANLVMACTLMWFVFSLLRSHPRLQLLVFALAATPTAIFQFASPGADAMTICLAFLVFALSVRLKDSWNTRLFWTLVAAAAALSLCKNVYLIIAAVAVPAIWTNGESARRRLGRSAVLAMAAVVPLVLWLIYIRDFTSTTAVAQQTTPSGQLRSIAAAPLDFLWAWASYLVRDAVYLRRGLVAQLGWGEFSIDYRITGAYLIGLIAVAAISTREPREKRWDGWVVAVRLLVWAAVALAIYLALYVMGGRQTMARTQARYYIPIAPLLFSSIPILVRLAPRWFGVWRIAVVGLWSVAMALAFVAVKDRYWGPDRFALNVASMHRDAQMADPSYGKCTRREDGMWVMPAPASTASTLAIPKKSRSVTIEYGMFDSAWSGKGNSDGIEVTVSLRPVRSATTRPGTTLPVDAVLWRRALNPRDVPMDRGAQVETIPLPEDGGQLVLQTLPGPAGDAASDWAYWRRVDFAVDASSSSKGDMR